MHIIPTMSTPTPSGFPTPPDFEAVQDKLQTLLPAIREAVQAGTLHVTEYFRWKARHIDFALAPNLLRYEAKQSLIDSGQEAKDENEEAGFGAEQIPNNGLCIKVQGFEIRILKSTEEGGIPPPGTSFTRRNLYNQRQAVFSFADPTWGIIVHWHVDRSYALLKLSIALPTSFDKNEDGKIEVLSHFDEPFWIRTENPAVSIIQEPEPVEDQNVEGIELDDQGEKTGEEPKGE